ncbi:glycerol-3-phosphate dehydrogenase/oxidase [Actinomadura nitritigenes]|uniref:Glycerol-3-phosphate dehydrogenase n=1 Tax=Actinomadura nitritigenes TaxID=134602 RepID=A0ABS3RE38_9ACTN|nr:glycerol-3-phosphate dehydrogenase/oxidase [Actinomadura nitritigenes]MBO2444302.1 glycerol-3-phosphate dehydrogenase/oxidase [Actinomadura nitritigenes]
MANRARDLGPEDRRRSLEDLAGADLDILIVGGGVVGCGAALDAVTRGLRVGLVEAQDFGSGTSSRSSKLIHGGLRYLEQLNLTLVREALRERSLILRTIAPHLARPVPFLYPLRHRIWERPYVGSGVLLYDTMGGRHGVPGHRHLSKKQALREFPGLRDDVFVGAVKYYDGQVDDARYTMILARTAAHYGALCVSGVQAERFIYEGPRVAGAVVRDSETGRHLEVRARHTINAAGVWTDAVREMGGGRTPFDVRASKGVHILVPKGRIEASAGIISRTEKSVLFIIPWREHWIIGTTDTPWDLDLRHPAASQRDIDYLLDHANRLLRKPLSGEDIVGVYAGLRPLLAGSTDETAELSREHAVADPVEGLTVVAGGKYTTYRVMAKDAVDAAVRGRAGRTPASCTHRLPLLGADGYVAAWNQRGLHARVSGLPVRRVEHLLRRYGSLTGELLDLIAERPRLGEPVEGAESYLNAEIYYGVLAEGALHLDDLLTRRTHISIEEPDRGLAAARPAADLVAPLLGWDQDDIDREVARYHARVEAELQSQAAPDDISADAVHREALAG